MNKPEVAIIDGGGANIASLRYALERLGASSRLTTDPSAIRNASHVILPGVGAARSAMDKLRGHDLDTLIPALEQPVLGICLGMQLLASGSDENDATCIGVFPERATKLAASPQTPVPNMGWCRIEKIGDDRLLDGIDDGAWFYFVHSYALPVSLHTIASARHTMPFAALIRRANFCAAQFHPERSSAAGARLLKNFLGMK
jgi:glutamine amidotransferase